MVWHNRINKKNAQQSPNLYYFINAIKMGAKRIVYYGTSV